MIIRHRSSKIDYHVSRENWEQLKALKMERNYIIIDQSELETKEIEIDITQIVKPIRSLVRESIETAIYGNDFNSANYTVNEIKNFVKDNDFDSDKFKNDKRKTILKLTNNE